jgi:hypothetical protein
MNVERRMVRKIRQKGSKEETVKGMKEEGNKTGFEYF